MAVIRVEDVIHVKGSNVENLPSFVIHTSNADVVTILPGLTLIIDSQTNTLSEAELVCGWASIQSKKDCCGAEMAKIYFSLDSKYYCCPETRSLLNGPSLCKLIANYLQDKFCVTVGLVYLTEDWKVGGHISARGHTQGRGEFLYYISNRCK